MANRFWKGLRTIEITIIFSIICILLTVIYLRYDSFRCRSMQSEAKFSLKEIYGAQMRYRSDFGRFATMNELVNKTKRIVLSSHYYEYIDEVEPTKLKFSVIAQGKKNTLVHGEIWSINEENELVNKKKICTKNP